MTDYVLEQKLKIENNAQNHIIFSTSGHLSKIFNYAYFLKQPLQLWMFVPCYLRDGIWIPYEKNTPIDSIDLFNEWDQAKDRCLVEGFEVDSEKNVNWNGIYIEEDSFNKIDVEGLEYYCSSTKIQLTQTAIKQLGL
jgi:hypothetical protein